MQQPTAWFLLFVHLGVRAEIVERSSCRDHYYAGKCRSAVLPLSNGKEVSNVQCNFPNFKTGGQVETIVRNALEFSQSIPDEFRSVGYQISRRKLLVGIIRDSERCKQEITITWPPPGHADIELTVESVTAQKYTITQNKTGPGPKTYELGLTNMAGIIYLRPKFRKFNLDVTLGPLRCFSNVTKQENCSDSATILPPFIHDARLFDFSKQQQTLRLGASEPTQTTWNVSAPTGRRIVKWRVQLRLPEVNRWYAQVVQIGNFVIQAGCYGKLLLVTSTVNSHVYGKFDVDPTDARLHLVYLEERPTDSTDGTVDFALYVDNYPSHTFRHPPIGPSTAVTVSAVEESDPTAFSGCLGGIFLGYGEVGNRTTPLEFANALREFPKKTELNDGFYKMLRSSFSGCGVYDENLWTSKSSSFGQVTSTDQFPKPRSFLSFLFDSGSFL